MLFVSSVIKIPNSIIFAPKPESITTPTKRSPFLRVTKSSNAEEEEGGRRSIRYEGTRLREKELTEMIEVKIKEAETACEKDKSSDGCKVAWDEVEEISEAKAKLRLQLLYSGDPLHGFCLEHPQAEECQIYQD